VDQVNGLDCNRVVELVTDFVEGALDGATEQRVRDHLAECPGCETYVEQIRQTVRALGEVDADALGPDAQAALLTAFRDFRREPRQE
jgi:anti-sigma factor RsiW